MNDTNVAGSLNLEKGQKVDLTKANPGLKIAGVGCGWDVNQNGGAAFDLDAFALLVSAGKTKEVVYFNDKDKPGVKHMGDNLTGAGDGDDETINITLAQVKPEIEEVVVGVNIYQATDRKQNFGQVKNAFIRVYDTETKQELMKFDLGEDASTASGMLLGKIYRKDGEWKFQAIGTVSNGDISQIAAAYRA